MEPPSHQNEEDLLFKGNNIHCRKEPLFEGWGDSLVYSGHFEKNANDPKEESVVRKINKTDCHDKWNDIFKKHTREKDPIKHDNVLKIIGYEEMNEFRFFALERYEATLEQFCKGIYKGPMPSDARVLCQITEGLLYLHAEKCTHGNLTPRTILIASSQPVRMMIKLSEFGLRKFGSQFDESELGEELCKRKYWRLLDETTDNNQQTPTPNQDIFAAGCLCFYFLKQGVHPFGDNSSSILENIQKRNPKNLETITQQEKGVWEFAYEPIENMLENMIEDPPTEGTNLLIEAIKSFKKALSLKVDEKKVLGKGTFGTVYKGTFDGNPVAVKQFQDNTREEYQKREMEEHFRLEHENVLKIIHLDELHDKTCLVLELCAGTLKDYCDKKYRGINMYMGPELPPDGLVLYQIANGLHYIHSRNLVHRDVKPDNILISLTTPVQMKLSDFGLVKKTSDRGSHSQSGLKGTPNWMAPEILELADESSNELPHGTIQSDTFAAGCVVFYVVTGRHPFDEPTVNVIDDPKKHPNEGKIWNNILKNKPIALNIELKKNLQDDVHALYELIRKMILKPLKVEEGREIRIALPDVIEQLTTKLYTSRKFKKSERSISERGSFFCRFHPTELVLACLVIDKVILLSAENSSIPFSNWKEKLPRQLETGIFGKYKKIEWNADGTQLAAISGEGDVIVWSYPDDGKIPIQQTNLSGEMARIEWNPFRPNVFATFHWISQKVFLFNSRPVDQRPFHFYTIECENWIRSVKWISANRVALGLFRNGGGIEIWEIDESTTSAKKIDKRFEHEDDRIQKVAWDERTKCLAACSFGGWLTIWSMDSDQPIRIHSTKVDAGVCWSLVWRPNGKQTDGEGVDAARKSADNFILVCGFDKGRIVIWTPLAKKKTRSLRQHSSSVQPLSFSPDGRFLASAYRGGKLIIWATEKWKLVYIGEEVSWCGSLSWFSSSTDIPDYKLACNSHDDKVRVIEYAVDQSKKPSEDVNDEMNEDRQEIEIPKIRGENSIPSSGVLDLT